MKKSFTGDFSQGSVSHAILRIGLPIMAAELVHVLYNLVDRMFISHMPDVGTLALTGVGVAFPLITIISAFANLCGTGGASLTSIARGEGDVNRARLIEETAYTMLIIMGGVLTVVMYAFAPGLLEVLGGDAKTLPYAVEYFRIYVLGSIPVLISLGMNPFINAQGFAGTGMLTVVIGALMNTILDPIMIYTMNMGVRGAALATIISQAVSADSSSAAAWRLHARYIEAGRDGLYLQMHQQPDAGDREYDAQELRRRDEHAVRGRDVGNQFPARGRTAAHHGRDQRRIARDELQFRRGQTEARVPSHRLYAHGHAGDEQHRVGAGHADSRTADRDHYARSRNHPPGRALRAHLLRRISVHVPANDGTEYLCGAEPPQARPVLLAVSQICAGNAAYAAAAPHRPRRGRRFLGGIHIAGRGRQRLHDLHVYLHLEKAEIISGR